MDGNTKANDIEAMKLYQDYERFEKEVKELRRQRKAAGKSQVLKAKDL